MRRSTPLQQVAAKAALRWLPLFILLLVVFPLAITLGVVRVHLHTGWSPVHSLIILNDADVVALAVLAAAATVPAVLVQRRLLDRLKAEAVRTENEAVARVCEVVAREFAQPLTGTLAYSELLLMDSHHPTDAQRRAIEGVREGVIRLDQLLFSLRDAVQAAHSPMAAEHVADDVVVAINRRPPRKPSLSPEANRPSHDAEPASKELDTATP